MYQIKCSYRKYFHTDSQVMLSQIPTRHRIISRQYFSVTLLWRWWSKHDITIWHSLIQMEQNDNAQIRNEFSHLNCLTIIQNAFLRSELWFTQAMFLCRDNFSEICYSGSLELTWAILQHPEPQHKAWSHYQFHAQLIETAERDTNTDSLSSGYWENQFYPHPVVCQENIKNTFFAK